jgi:hypothetical protein
LCSKVNMGVSFAAFDFGKQRTIMKNWEAMSQRNAQNKLDTRSAVFSNGILGHKQEQPLETSCPISSESSVRTLQSKLSQTLNNAEQRHKFHMTSYPMLVALKELGNSSMH